MASTNRDGGPTETDDHDLIHRLEVFVTEDETWGRHASFKPVTNDPGILVQKEGPSTLYDLNERGILDPINEAITDIDLDAYDPGKIGEVNVYSDDTFEIDV